MPSMSGYDGCELLKQHSQHRQIPIIFLSAMTSADDVTKAFLVGGVDYVPKPLRLHEAEARIGAVSNSGACLKRQLVPREA